MNAPYLLVPIGMVLVILYGISYLFSRLDIFTKSQHRGIWNYSLLATFLLTAVLGILMAIQINYKLEVRWTEKVLKWHVNFGIGMSVVGLFHLLWHFKYYFPFRSHPGNHGRPLRASRTGGPQSPPVKMFLIGFTGIAFQTFLIRELLSLFQGNELMLAIIMFLWLLISGAGAMAGNRIQRGISEEPGKNARKSKLLVITLIILPFLLIPLLYYCKSLFFAPGIEAGPAAFAAFLLLVLTPFCFLNGFAFTFIIRLLQSAGLNIRKGYVWESVGGSVAGVTATVAILLGIFSFPGTRLIEKLVHPNDEIIATRSGSSGRLTITKNGEQLNIFENGVLVQSSGNTLVCEEIAHFSMIQHPDPHQILVIGGFLSGVATELAKYPGVSIDLAEPDQELFKLAKRLGLIPEYSVPHRYIRKNIIRWLNNSDNRYDIILVMLPGPQTLSLNRFYTQEFFAKLKKCMNPDGSISIMLPGTGNYISNEAIAAIGPVINAMRRTFPYADIFPGENNYLLAGNDTPKTDVLSELKTRNIPALYISKGYFDEDLFHSRFLQINDLTKSEPAVNSDFKPSAYFGQIAWWLGQFPSKMLWPLLALLVILVISSLAAGGAAYSGMFMMGAGSAGIEITLLFLMQITAGSMYLFTGLLLALFMAGLAAGSLFSSKGSETGSKFGLTETLLLFTLATASTAGLAIWMIKTGNLMIIKTILVILSTFLIAFISGRFFSLMTVLLPDQKSSGKLYVFDLLGAAIGALIYPLVVIPIFGLLSAIGIISVSGVLILILLKGGRKGSPV